jgi:hypothetical protein
LQQTTLLFNHLVGARERRCWNFEAACIRHDEVDDEIEFDALLDRNIGAARFTASASDGSCRLICSNLSFRYTQVLNRDIGDADGTAAARAHWRIQGGCP